MQFRGKQKLFQLEDTTRAEDKSQARVRCAWGVQVVWDGPAEAEG